MRMTKILVLSATLMLVFLLGPGSLPAENLTLHDFDRNACYSTCPCGVRGMEASCNECIQECDRQFWASFDKETAEDKVGSMDDDDK